VNAPAPWQELLAECRGAPGAAQRGSSEEETRAALQQDICADLSSWTPLAVRGEDARDFLRRMLTSTVTKVGPRQSELSAWCKTDGRVRCILLLLELQGTLHLALPRELAAAAGEELRRFILRSRVGIEDRGETVARMGLAGDGAPARVARYFGAAPEAPWETASGDAGTAIRLPGGRPRFFLAGDAAALAALWREGRDELRPVGAQAWALLDILAGLPWIGERSSGAYLPQMLDLLRLGALDLQKGCFPGQEIVVRVHHRGSLKQRLYRLAAPAPLQPGDGLRTAEEETLAGTVINAAPSPDGGAALAVVRIAATGRRRLQLERDARIEVALHEAGAT